MNADLSLFHILQRHGVPFVIVGGHAVNYHGCVRVTEDSDVSGYGLLNQRRR